MSSKKGLTRQLRYYEVRLYVDKGSKPLTRKEIEQKLSMLRSNKNKKPEK